MGSVRNLKRSESLSLQEKAKKQPVIVINITRFFIVFDLNELTEQTNDLSKPESKLEKNTVITQDARRTMPDA